MESFKCSIHEEKSIIGFCVNKQCLSQRSCCLRCLQEFHTEHPKEIIELGDLNKWIQPNNQALSKIQQQIKDIEYVVQIVKLSFENYMKYLTLNKNNLNLIIQASLNLDLKQTQFIKVIVCLREFSRNIIRINSQIDNLISKDQGEELIKQKKWDQSIEYFTQLLEQENLKKKLSLSQQTVITLFNCFELEEKSKRIDPLKHKIAIQNKQIPQKYAYIYPQFKTKFRIIKLKGCISIGICFTITQYEYDELIIQIMAFTIETNLRDSFNAHNLYSQFLQTVYDIFKQLFLVKS